MAIEDWEYWGNDAWYAGVIWKPYIAAADIDSETTVTCETSYIAGLFIDIEAETTVTVDEDFTAGASSLIESETTVTVSEIASFLGDPESIDSVTTVTADVIATYRPLFDPNDSETTVTVNETFEGVTYTGSGEIDSISTITPNEIVSLLAKNISIDSATSTSVAAHKTMHAGINTIASATNTTAASHKTMHAGINTIASATNTTVSETYVENDVPGDIPDLILWLDAQDTSTMLKPGGSPVTTHGDRIETWTDKSGNGYDFAQTNSAKRPFYSATGSPTWIGFDSDSNRRLHRTGLAAIDDLEDYTMIVVYIYLAAAERINDVGDMIRFGMSPIAGRMTLTLNATLGDNSLELTVESDTPATITDTYDIADTSEKGYSICVKNTAGNISLITNEGGTGFVAGSPNATNITSDYAVIGNNHNTAGTGTGFVGYIGEVFFYGHSLTVDELTLIEGYLDAKWGIA